MTSAQGLPREFFQGGTRQLWGSQGRAENTPHKKKKNLNKTFMARLWNASKIHGAFCDLWTDIPAEQPSLIGHASAEQKSFFSKTGVEGSPCQTCCHCIMPRPL